VVKADNVPLSEKAAEQIIRFIQESRMQKGDRLPNEKNFVDQLNVSRSTIREAMRTLSSRGIVVIRQGSGTYISNLPGVAEDPLGLQFKYDKSKVLTDLLELRFMMEPAIASYSAERACKEEVEEIMRLARMVSARIRAGESHIEADVAFHCKVAQSTGNDILNVLFPEIVKGIRLFTTLLGDRIIQGVVTDHEKIAIAISTGDSEGAYDAMRVHLERNKYAIEDYLCQNSSKEKTEI
jgi:GntR family transcriptional repressor for pyruvate dehydrogenase complex